LELLHGSCAARLWIEQVSGIARDCARQQWIKISPSLLRVAREPGWPQAVRAGKSEPPVASRGSTYDGLPQRQHGK
jgi:hypothetical protein